MSQTHTSTETTNSPPAGCGVEKQPCSNNSSPRDYLSTIAFILTFPAALAIWFAFDSTWPYWDGASHVHDSMKYMDLINQIKPFSLSWWHDILTVNYCYAPESHFYLGLLKVITGKGLFSDQLATVLYSIILCASTYFIGFKLLGSRVKALASVLALNSFTLVMNYSHLTYLEYSCLAMFSLAMAYLIHWQDNKTWRNTIILGVILGLAASSKQLVSYFLLLPCLISLARLAIARDRKGVQKLAGAGVIASLFLLIWVLPNYAEIKAFTQRPCPIEGNPSFLDIFLANMNGYAIQAKGAISPLLLSLFGLALLTNPKILFGKLALVTSSAFGILCMCTISYNNPEARYLIPAYLLLALVIGNFLGQLLENGNKLVKCFGIILVATIALQYFVYNFTPYPVSQPQPLLELSKVFQVKDGSIYSYLPGKHPTPKGDIWGQKWIVDSINSFEKGRPVYLCVVPNDPRYNVHTLNLIARINDSKVQATTNRLWTLKGDEIDFDINQLKHYHWYLIKTKDGKKRFYEPFSQEKPKDESSAKALQRTVKHIKLNSKLIFEKSLVDGSVVCLYQNKSLAGK